MGLLILRRKDSGTRNYFLGETSGPYIWGKEKCTLGISGRQGGLAPVLAPFDFAQARLCGVWIEFAALRHS